MLERILTFIKPDHVEIADKIFSELDEYGTRIATVKVDAVPKEIIEAHYSVHEGKPFYPLLLEYFTGKSVVVAVYEGDDIIRKFNELIGPTEPSSAPKDTLRAKYSNDSKEKAVSERRPISNVIHRSDSKSEALREISVWAEYLKLN